MKYYRRRRRYGIINDTVIGTVIDTLFPALVLVAIVSLVGWGLLVGIDKETVVRCEKLKQQSDEFDDFYLTKNEKKVCDELGIKIVARIK